MITNNRFNSIKYFIFIIVITIIAFNIFYNHYLSNQVKRAVFTEKRIFTKIIAQKLSDDLKEKIIIPSTKKETTTNKEEVRKKINHLITDYQNKFNIHQINLIHKDSLFTFISTKKELEEYQNNKLFQKALTDEIRFKLEEIPNNKARNNLKIFFPLKMNKKVIGVLVIYQNINATIQRININQRNITKINLISMLLLLLLLFSIIKQSYKIIKTQEEELIEFNYQLEEKVKARTKKLEEINHELKDLAIKDGLTGLYNQTEIKKHLSSLFEEAQMTNKSFSYLMIDIDHFKRLNDNFGHPFGDKVLKRVATAITEATRKHDILGRYGGEEFAVILPNVNYNKSYDIAERIRKNIKRQLFTVNNQRIKVTVSIGISTYANQESPADLLNQADQALYKAKNKGRNQVIAMKNCYSV